MKQKTERFIDKIKKIPSKVIAECISAFEDDGSLILKENDKVYIERRRSGKLAWSECTVKNVEQDGHIHVFDETLSQWFTFMKNEAESTGMNIKKPRG